MWRNWEFPPARSYLEAIRRVRVLAPDQSRE
jgi:hypothetical protein